MSNRYSNLPISRWNADASICSTAFPSSFSPQCRMRSSPWMLVFAIVACAVCIWCIVLSLAFCIDVRFSSAFCFMTIETHLCLDVEDRSRTLMIRTHIRHHGLENSNLHMSFKGKEGRIFPAACFDSHTHTITHHTPPTKQCTTHTDCNCFICNEAL